MISVLLPTRNRVTEFSRMLASIYETAQREVEVVAYVDDDDPARDVYRGVGGVRWLGGPRIIMTQYWNECARAATGEIFMQGNDDVIFRTRGWDAQVEAAFARVPDKILMVHGDDLGCQGSAFGPHPFVHRRWVETLGYFIPPYFSSDFGDTWVNVLANALGRRRYLPFVVEHMHSFFGKAKADATTTERLERHRRDEPAKVWDSLEPQRQTDIAKLRAAIAGGPRPRVRWSILILTQPSRTQFLSRLLGQLDPQVAVTDDVEVVVRTFDPRLSLGANRQAMREQALGEYSCFVDDDDVLATDYVARIRPLLDGVDYVGFRVQTYVDDRPLEPTFHSLRYKGWTSDARGHYRELSHLNPIRRELALAVPMEGGYGEDSRWAHALAERKIVKTERYVDDVMYFYYSRTNKGDDVARQTAAPQARVVAPAPLAHAMIAPTLRPARPNVSTNNRVCPRCLSKATTISNGVTRCNQCGHQF